MRIASLLLASFLLLSCGRDAGQETSNAGAAGSTQGTSNARAVAPEDSSSERAGGEESAVPAASKGRDWFFVGRWASDVKNCGDKAWDITAQGLRTPGHVVCRFDEVEPTTRGAAAHAICTAEGPPQPWTIQFSYAESARALLIEDAPFADVGLVACAAP